jgi:hypothetical protein
MIKTFVKDVCLSGKVLAPEKEAVSTAAIIVPRDTQLSLNVILSYELHIL